MANCPNCGSAHIALKKEDKVNWGRAVAGWALFGVVGGAVGAVTGRNRTVNACLDCGTSWNATDLHQVLKVIKSLMDIELNRSNVADRLYMNSFVEEVGPFLESLSKAEEKSKKLITEVESEETVRAVTGCGYGCISSVVIIFIGASALSTGSAFLVVIIPPLLGIGLGVLTNQMTKKETARKIQAVKDETSNREKEATEDLNFAVRDFLNKHSDA